MEFNYNFVIVGCCPPSKLDGGPECISMSVTVA